MVDQLWYLKNCSLFRGLSPEHINRLESRSKFRKYDAKSLVYLPADDGDSALLLATGRVKLYHVTSDGRQSVLAIIEPGELFGELNVIESGEREEFAQTMEPSSIIMIPGDEIRQLMEQQATVSLELTRLMGLRRRRVERRIKSLLYRTPRERMACLLLELTERYAEPCNDGLLLNIRLSHQDMSSIIGTTREMVTVMLGELRTNGVIDIRRRRVILKDAAMLAASVGESPPNFPRTARPERIPVPLNGNGAFR